MNYNLFIQMFFLLTPVLIFIYVLTLFQFILKKRYWVRYIKISILSTVLCAIPFIVMNISYNESFVYRRIISELNDSILEVSAIKINIFNNPGRKYEISVVFNDGMELENVINNVSIIQDSVDLIIPLDYESMMEPEFKFFRLWNKHNQLDSQYFRVVLIDYKFNQISIMRKNGIWSVIDD